MESLPESVVAVVTFGAFEVDLRAGELRRHGRKVKIQNQPFQILAMLLERPGEIVTREEMRARLWPAETFVDFDHGLNSAVRRLRDVLSDSAENPTYIETLGRRGYRFIFPTERNANRPRIAHSEMAGAAATVVPISVAASEHLGAIAPKSRARAKMAAAVLCGIVVGALLYFCTRTPAMPTVSKYFQLTHDGREKWIVGTDGSRLLLGLGTAGPHNIGEISVGGGEIHVIPTPASTNMIPLALSADGSRLLVVDGQGEPYHGKLFSLPLPSGAPSRLGDIEARSGSWSPDGKMLAYSLGNELFLASADGTEPRKLTAMRNPTRIDEIEWSPDESHLRFQANERFNEPFMLWDVSTKDGPPKPLFAKSMQPAEAQCCGKWTADGKYFVFMAGRQIWVLPKASKFQYSRPRPVQLTSSPMFLSSPVPGKDGKKLFVMGYTMLGELTRYDPRSKQFELFLGGVSAEYIDFSKDGQWVAYVSFPDGALWRSKADGSERRLLVRGAGYPLMPRWSPDGTRIVYADAVADKPPRIYEVSVEGGTPREVMPDVPADQVDPNWSPDGQKIVFGGASGDPASTIRVLDVRTRQVASLPGSTGLFSPRWSPNGRYIAALNSDSSSLYLFDSQSEKWNELAKRSVGGFPNWSKDSQYIYVFTGPASGVVRVRISDGNVEQVAELQSFQHAGRYSRSLALAADDSLILLRDRSTQDVYSVDWQVP